MKTQSEGDDYTYTRVLLGVLLRFKPQECANCRTSQPQDMTSIKADAL